ncbi:CHASE2 domain-containing protein [bacterium]|nr:CHASE2 domain-containing protein [bacterium]
MGSRIYSFFKKNASKASLILALCITSYVFSNVYSKPVDIFARDFLQFFNSPINSTISSQIAIVDIDSNTINFSSPLRFTEIEKLILALKKYDPQAILLNIEPIDFTDSLDERKKLYQFLKTNNIYLSKYTKSRSGKIKFYEDSVFSDYEPSYPSTFTTDDNDTYASPRRMLLQFFGESNNTTLHTTLEEMGLKILPISNFQYAFERMNTLQLFNKFYKSAQFNALEAEKVIVGNINPNALKEKVVVLGRVDEFSFMASENPLNLFGKPLASSNLNDSLTPLHHILANQISTLQTGDYIKYINGKYILYVLSLVLILLILIEISAQKKLYIFLLILPLAILSQILLYSSLSYYMDMTSTYIMLISIQYIAVPVILLAMFKQKERQKLQDISDTRIDALLSVSEKVAHDIRSPLSAIGLILSRTKFENPEHKEIVNNALKRIDETAENILTKYTSKDQSKNTFDNVDLHEMLSKLISEKQFLDPEIEFILNSNSTKIFASAHSIELERVLSNIFDNSIFALKNKKPRLIKVSLKISNNKIILEIYDNGTGIPNSVLKLLGQKQFTTKLGQKGNGIGLLHAKRTIDRMGGNLKIESTENEYSRVTIKLQLAT